MTRLLQALLRRLRGWWNKSPRNLTETILSRDVLVKGALIGQGTIVVKGRVEGTIHGVGKVVIEVEGRVRGHIEAHTLLIHGWVHGNGKAEAKVEISHTGRLVGDIRAAVVIIHEGGVLQGRCDMGTQERQNVAFAHDGAGILQKNTSRG